MNFTIYRQLSLLIGCLLFLSACSLLSPVKMDIPSKYRLTCIPSFSPTKIKKTITIVVNTPDTSPVYDTTKMAYTIRPYQIAYFSRNEWAGPPAEMLKPLLVETLGNTKHFKAVMLPSFNGQADYMLNTEILEFNQDFTHHTPRFIMVVRAQISKIATNKVIATKQFSVILPLPYATPYGGVLAANHAAFIILRKIAMFCRAVTL